MTEGNGQSQFGELYKAMKAACEAQDAAGWASPEVQRLSVMILCALENAAHGRRDKVLFDSLRDYTAHLEAARAAAKRGQED